MKVKEILKKSINEEVHGFLATVYHRTKAQDLINHIYTSGFKPGEGAMYGKGFYSTYDLASQQRDYMKGTYGNVVVKFAVKTQNFFFFDWEAFANHPMAKFLQATKDDYLQKQDEYYKLGIGFNIKNPKYTSDFAHRYWSKMQKKGLNGIVFSGRRDGRVLVAWNTSLINPISYYIDEDGEREWIKADGNKDYLKKWSASYSEERVDATKVNVKNLTGLISDKSKPKQRREQAIEKLIYKGGATLNDIVGLYKKAPDVFNKYNATRFLESSFNSKTLSSDNKKNIEALLMFLKSGIPLDYKNEKFTNVVNRLLIHNKKDEKASETIEEIINKLKENNFDFSFLKKEVSHMTDIGKAFDFLKAGIIDEEEKFLLSLIKKIVYPLGFDVVKDEDVERIGEYIKNNTSINKDEIYKKAMEYVVEKIGYIDDKGKYINNATKNLKKLNLSKLESENANEVIKNTADKLPSMDLYVDTISRFLSKMDKSEVKKMDFENIYQGMEDRARKTNDSSYFVPLKFGKKFENTADFDRLLKIMMRCKDAKFGLMSVTKTWPEGSYDPDKIVDLLIKKDKKGEILTDIFLNNMGRDGAKTSNDVGFKLTKEHLEKAIKSLEKSKSLKENDLKKLKDLNDSLNENLQYQILKMIR